MSTVISIENVSKLYRLGEIGTSTLKGDFERFWAKLRGRPDPISIVDKDGDQNRSNQDYVWALRDINLKIEKGALLGIIGSNGAGKSTLLKIISRITAPTKGVIKANGRIASLLEVGTGFHRELTGRENIYLNGAIHGMKRREIDKKLDKIIEFSGVGYYIDTPVKRYSSGMHVRLGFAVAAHLDPDILVVDEVLAVGDFAFQKKSIGKMSEAASEGRTVIFVSHNMNSIRNLCNEVIWIKDGKINEHGPTEKTIQSYLSMSSDQTAKAKIQFSEADKTKEVRPISLGFLNEDGQLRTLFLSHEPIIVDFKFEIFQTLPKFMTYLSMVDAVGTPIVTHWSKIRDLTPGKYQVRFHFNIPLAANELKFNIGFDSNGITFHNLKNVGNISISESENKHRHGEFAPSADLLLGEQDTTIDLLENSEE